MADGYVVAIKASARRRNRAAAEWVGRRGATRAFESKDRARAWSEAVSALDGPVRVQDAAPNDPDPVDGYVVADPAARRNRGSNASPRQTLLDG